MENQQNKIRIAAVGDIHVRLSDKGKWVDCFKTISDKADVLVLCGDLTDTGHANEAEVLAEELRSCSIPVIAVLGNHDYDNDEQEDIKNALAKSNISILDGESIVVKGIGFAGIKGFCGGFDRHTMPLFGEKMNKQYVKEAVNEALKLDQALVRLEYEDVDIKKVAVLHYSPVKDTVVGEPEQIFPFLGSSRLAEPIETREVEVVFHGHAHMGTLEGRTSKGVKVYNVSAPILKRAGYSLPFFLYEIEVNIPSKVEQHEQVK